MSSEAFSEKENPIGDYLLSEELGSGGFAKVVQAIHIPTGERVAVKIMDKNQIFSEPLNLNRIRREIAILKIVRHKNIIKLYELMETPHKIYLVMEYCNGGELFDYIVSKQHLTEKQACHFFHEIIDSLEYLHSLNIVHRDIKPENLLLDTTQKQISLKLIDFGISNCYSPEKLLTTPCGTASYAPPEMHKGEEYYGLLSDVWSAGVVLYAMVFGYLPFCEDDEDTNITNIIEGNYEIPEEASPELADLLIHLLDINPLTRYDLEQIKKHPWFNIVKPYVSYPGVIEGYHRIPIDMKIVEACEQYGYDRNKIIQSVKKCKYNRNSAVYYIILSRMKREGYTSISDLYSDKFLNFINDPKNIIFEKDENEIEDYDYNDNKYIDKEKEEDNIFKKENSVKNIYNQIKRQHSLPINDESMNIKAKLLSLDVKENDKNEKNKKSNKKRLSNPSADIKNDNKVQKTEISNENSNINKIKKKGQNQSTHIYEKPKIKAKRNKNDKNSNHEEELKRMTINKNTQINKDNNNDLNNMSSKKRNSKKDINKKPKVNNVNNNNSFTQNIKNKNKKSKENNDEVPKDSFQYFSNKKPEDNALKTEIIRKNLNKKIIPMNSYHLLSKTKEILNSLNDNESINIDYMNTSFNKKLSDDIKENILKLKNPKKKLPEKEKEKKINNALLSLKMKKKKKKVNNYNYGYNYSNKKNKNKKINIKAPIFKVNSRKDHTIIHNRNASLIVEQRNYNKNISNDNNRKRKDFSMSPNISKDRRNIINIYVQNKNSINSNNVYNINLITKNNYSIENSSMNRKKGNFHNNSSNIKVKKNKVSRQKLKSIDDKNSVNSNNYIYTTNANSSFSNRNLKYEFQTPNKINKNLYFEKPSKVLSNSTIHYQPTTHTHNNEIYRTNINNRGLRAQSQKFNKKQNKPIRSKKMYNNSFNDFYNKNKKKIRLSFKPIKENEIDNQINISKQNFNINNFNSNHKIKKVNSSVKNSARISNNNKYHHHYKSRSLMEIENNISLKKNPINNINKNKENIHSNYLITNNKSMMINNNQKITKIKSTRCASVKPIDTSNNYCTNYSTKLRKKIENVSFIGLRNNDSKKIFEPRKYKGPVDLKCLLIAYSVNLLIEKISILLRKNKISKTFINPYRMRCNKGGEIFDIEIMCLNENPLRINYNKGINEEFMNYKRTSYNPENDIKYKTITESKNEKNPVLYYLTILSKGNNKNVVKTISKMICSKFNIFKKKNY